MINSFIIQKRIQQIAFISFVIICGCKNSSRTGIPIDKKNDIKIASEFIDAFYSFDRYRLKEALSNAQESQPAILYYQKWAECGNYEINKRHDCIVVNDSIIKCPVTVKDDLIGALGLDFNVTDTFHLKILNGYIRSVNTSSNDPDLYYDAKGWVKVNRPELIKEPCEGIWEGGPTPCECVRAMVEGFTEFISVKNSAQNLQSAKD